MFSELKVQNHRQAIHYVIDEFLHLVRHHFGRAHPTLGQSAGQLAMSTMSDEAQKQDS